MCVCMKSVAKQPTNLCIISVIYYFVYVPHFLKVHGACFPVEHLESLIDKINVTSRKRVWVRLDQLRFVEPRL